jgi:hypothetical protein
MSIFAPSGLLKHPQSSIKIRHEGAGVGDAAE